MWTVARVGTKSKSSLCRPWGYVWCWQTRQGCVQLSSRTWNMSRLYNECWKTDIHNVLQRAKHKGGRTKLLLSCLLLPCVLWIGQHKIVSRTFWFDLVEQASRTAGFNRTSVNLIHCVQTSWYPRTTALGRIYFKTSIDSLATYTTMRKPFSASDGKQLY